MPRHHGGQHGRHGHHGRRTSHSRSGKHRHHQLVKHRGSADAAAFSDPSGSDDEEEQQKWPRDLDLDDDAFVLKYR